jgi:hypothetical protein
MILAALNPFLPSIPTLKTPCEYTEYEDVVNTRIKINTILKVVLGMTGIFILSNAR